MRRATALPDGAAADGASPGPGPGKPLARSRWWQPLLAAALSVAAALCALSLGTPFVPPHRILGAALEGDATLAGIVLVELRLPRLLLALVAGACLGAAGLVLQEALRNPLAVPEMLGVSSGAAMGVAAPLVMAVALPAAVQPLLAIGGAVLGGGLTLLAAGLGRSPSAVLLTGAAVAAALQAALLVMMVMADQLDLQLIYRYLLGSLSARTWDDVSGLWPWLLVAAPALALCAPVLSVMRLGDEDAEALGVRAQRARLAALAIAVVLIAPVTAVCGPVAWVGFLAPHLARRFAPTATAVRWLPWSAVWGAVVVAVADVPARLALAPVETPAGAWTALLGVPAGVALMRSSRRGAAARGGPGAPGGGRSAAVRALLGGPRSAPPDGAGAGPGPGGGVAAGSGEGAGAEVGAGSVADVDAVPGAGAGSAAGVAGVRAHEAGGSAAIRPSCAGEAGDTGTIRPSSAGEAEDTGAVRPSFAGAEGTEGTEDAR